MGWHGDIEHRGFDPDIASAEARVGGGPGFKCGCTGPMKDWKCDIHCKHCGKHKDCHPVTDARLKARHGDNFRELGFEPHEFEPTGGKEDV